MIDERRKQRDTVDFTMTMFSGFGDPGMTIDGAESASDIDNSLPENPETKELSPKIEENLEV
jgi:hypothetical protein